MGNTVKLRGVLRIICLRGKLGIFKLYQTVFILLLTGDFTVWFLFR